LKPGASATGIVLLDLFGNEVLVHSRGTRLLRPACRSARARARR
jgi:hypothetical protein